MLNVGIWQKKGPHRTCQDAFRLENTPDETLVAMADGHGDICYVRSGIGARIACAAAVKRMKQGISPEAFAATVKDDFDRMVCKHLKMFPLTEWELNRMDGLEPLRAYGTTLLAARITPEETQVFQIGDGAIHAIDTNGRFLPQLRDDTGCMGRATSSLAQNRQYVLEHFRSSQYPACAAVMLFTDGYQCHGRPLEAAEAMSDFDAIPAVLQKGERGDDQTFFLAVQSDTIAAEAFSFGLAAEIVSVRQEQARQRMFRRAHEEYRSILYFLNKAEDRRKELTEENSPDLAELEDRIQVKLNRLNTLCDLLTSDSIAQKEVIPCH